MNFTVNDGDRKWMNLKGELHREDGPAVEYADGTKKWFLNNELHRLDGPAIEDLDGTKEWYVNNELHREDGPAVCGISNGLHIQKKNSTRKY